MKVFISGATGFLGKHTTKRLSEMGYSVIAYGRNEEAAKFFVNMSNVTFIKGDLNNSVLLNENIKNVDYVIHCAALAAPFGDYSEFEKTNVEGTKNIVNAALLANLKKFVNISTPSVYFTNESRKNVKESGPLPTKHSNYYAKTKHLADLIIEDAIEKGLPAISLRPRQIFGPFDHTIFGRFIQINEDGGIPLVHSGQVLMDFTYIDNVVDMIIACMKADHALNGEYYNITNDQPIYLIDVLKQLFLALNKELNTKNISPKLLSFIATSSELIAKITKKPPKVSNHIANFLTYDYTLNIEKIKNDLNYEPKVSINEGIERYADWYLTSNELK
ncbi:3-beta hydroxysteroid dehydrogenase [Bacillus sp. AFS002410]|uniref:NAD-dependent epimerase/dehydratase family protein n=1 Tax=Bacillus sp. AFS002410 TaxID=2033481 RepID=UPI000BF0815E|nr:NAD(P)-dependent oxidoreductase [Bacillus sp. AFS002410]PEJ59537.1 3-beta hydroxysteroid dehydrogenase [Bacillus sp. AFS002410]